jgi:hypothetical protein
VDANDELMRIINCGDKLGTYHDLIYPLMRQPRKRWSDDVPFLALAALLSQKGGNIDRCRQGQQETLQDLGIDRPVVSERTIKRAIKNYGRTTNVEVPV